MIKLLRFESGGGTYACRRAEMKTHQWNARNNMETCIRPQMKEKQKGTLTHKQSARTVFFEPSLGVGVCSCSLCVCVCMSVRDILGCDSVRGARWFPKQAVSLTEGLFVKENTGKNLSMSKVC